MGTTNPYQVPLPPSVGTSDGSVAAPSKRSRISAHTSQYQQARDKLTHLLSITYPTNRHLLIGAVVIRLSTIYCLRATKRADIESLLIPNGSAPPPDDIMDLLLLSQYADCYTNTRGNNITRSMWSEMNLEHYELFYFTGEVGGSILPRFLLL